MPGRAIINSCVSFIASVRKISNKGAFSEAERQTQKAAMVIAALSSGHSWKTYRYINNLSEFDKEAICGETAYAFSEGWKSITESDVEEVMTSDINNHNLSMWMFHSMCKEERSDIIGVFSRMKKELSYALEPIEKAEKA